MTPLHEIGAWLQEARRNADKDAGWLRGFGGDGDVVNR